MYIKLFYKKGGALFFLNRNIFQKHPKMTERDSLYKKIVSIYIYSVPDFLFYVKLVKIPE
jgi:hypothetical protein